MKYLRTCSQERGSEKIRPSLPRRANGAKKRRAAGNHKGRVYGDQAGDVRLPAKSMWPHINWSVQVSWPMAAQAFAPVRLYVHKCGASKTSGRWVLEGKARSR